MRQFGAHLFTAALIATLGACSGGTQAVTGKAAVASFPNGVSRALVCRTALSAWPERRLSRIPVVI